MRSEFAGVLGYGASCRGVLNEGKTLKPPHSSFSSALRALWEMADLGRGDGN